MTINVVLVGLGYMGRLTARYLVEKNYNIVAAVSRTSFVGQDLGEVAGLPEPLGIEVGTSLEDALGSQKVDVAIVTTSSDVESLTAIAVPCLSAGVNVVTITEEAFFPRFSAEKGDKLDALAKENGVTLVATGVQDIFWLNLPAMLTGACHRIERMNCVSNVNLDVYGPALVSQYPLDLSQEEYDEAALKNDARLIPFSGIALEALAEKMGLTPTRRATRHEPIFDIEDIISESLGRTIKAGRTCGVTEIYEIETEQGVQLQVRFIEKLNRPDEDQVISWEIIGEPKLNITTNRFPGEEVTCATTVNRIPDVIAAEPGFLSSGVLPAPSNRTSAAS